MQGKNYRSIILIPSLEPDDRLPAYVQSLLDGGLERVVVVDDGSSAAAEPIFGRIDDVPGATVLHYEDGVNRGKGYAMKFGFRWILENCPGYDGVITADADGQHTVEDCLRLAEKLAEGEHALYLGSRDFSLPNVPARSRKGNRITSAVFKALYGVYLPDTQTGLRAFPYSDLPMMAEVEGDRYEYEMKVLIACARAGIPMIPMTIRTVYENNNEGSHFHPVRDSWRIYKVLLGGFLKFAMASILSWVVDQGCAHVLFYLLLPALGVSGTLQTGISSYGARVVSSAFNYLVNRNVVFRHKGKAVKSLARYAVLCVGIITLSTLFVMGLQKVFCNERLFWLYKIAVDLVLYLVSYKVQSDWVFKEEHE